MLAAVVVASRVGVEGVVVVVPGSGAGVVESGKIASVDMVALGRLADVPVDSC